ncbi:type II toxin-antitoxin system mRNA interferase toxin, RelE/StbE family [Candidatus Saccharibacteria bacterium]|nr:MAG: type II toxin-antitoxin system mRNA interferase toxin, RelE/StbE family [Candidatus Saccharibacteria bacterium]
MFAKLPAATRNKAIMRLQLFAQDPLSPRLRNHALHTPYKGCYSIDITGDIRAIYYLVDDATALFTHIGTHSQLYR